VETVTRGAENPRGAVRTRGGTRYRNQATQRVLAVLSTFVGGARDRGVSELSRALGMSKNMVHRALTTLTAAGYLVRDAGGERYQVGYRVLSLPTGEDDEVDMRALCRPALEALHALTGESVFLSIVVGRSRVNIDWIEARGRRVSHAQRGRSVPLHCTRMSRVLLACLSDAEIDQYLKSAAPLDRHDALFPETAGETAEDVWGDVRRVRRDGYLVWRNPQQYSSAYVGFPIVDGSGRPHALITVGGPIERFPPERISALIPSIGQTLEPLRQQASLVPAAPIIMDATLA
jgi:DNA-binding IclR family transcriptional regulator